MVAAAGFGPWHWLIHWACRMKDLRFTEEKGKKTKAAADVEGYEQLVHGSN